MSAESGFPYRLFLTQHKAKGTVLFSVHETANGATLNAVATFDAPSEAHTVAAALNAALQGGDDAMSWLHRCPSSQEGPRSKAIADLVEDIAARHRDAEGAQTAAKAARTFAANLEHPSFALLSLFPTTACGSCSMCGCTAAEDCSECSVCGHDGRDCENCGIVEVTPRTAYVLHHEFRQKADRTYLTVRSGLWEYSVPDSVDSQSDWFLLHCARAYDDLANDLLLGSVPKPHCLGESVALGYTVSDLLGSTLDDSVYEHATYRDLPASRYDNDWEFLASGEFSTSDKVKHFLDSDTIEEDLWKDWFTAYPGVEPRDRDRGFRC